MQVLKLTAALGLGALAACSSGPRPRDPFPAEPMLTGAPADARYRLYPGDQVEISVTTAPELSRTVTVGPDGRVSLSLGQPVMATGRTPEEVALALSQSLAAELNDPSVTAILAGTGSQRVFVGGEVKNPGMFDLPGQIDPLQAIIMAGDFTDRARTKQVVLMRRLPGGELTSAVLDIRSGVYDARLADWTPLRRFDVVYVPKSAIAEENLFVAQWIRGALPLEFQFFYDIRGQ